MDAWDCAAEEGCCEWAVDTAGATDLCHVSVYWVSGGAVLSESGRSQRRRSTAAPSCGFGSGLYWWRSGRPVHCPEFRVACLMGRGRQWQGEVGRELGGKCGRQRRPAWHQFHSDGILKLA